MEEEAFQVATLDVRGEGGGGGREREREREGGSQAGRQAGREGGRERVSSNAQKFVMTCFSRCAGVFCFSGFLSLYLSGKLQIFRPPGRGQAWKLCVVLAPLMAACVVATTRIQDYKHHWEGV